MKKLIFTTVLASIVILAAPALADWNVGDGHKMHFPQLPDPNGWDVDFTGRALADDFLCTQSGLITDVHFWASWAHDVIPSDPNGLQGIGNIVLGIFDNVPAGTASFSKPEEDPLWVYNVGRNFTVRPEAPSPQGWYEPAIGEEYYEANNHSQYFQYNIIIPEAEAFCQQANTIYWLGMMVTLEGNPTVADFKIGWKTSTSQWMDDAVWMPFVPNDNDGADGNSANNHIGWQELRDPVTGESLDLAFVITPEPATLAVLGLGGVVFLRRKRRI